MRQQPRARRARDWRELVAATRRAVQTRRTWQPAEGQAVLWAARRIRELERIVAEIRVELIDKEPRS